MENNKYGVVFLLTLHATKLTVSSKLLHRMTMQSMPTSMTDLTIKSIAVPSAFLYRYSMAVASTHFYVIYFGVYIYRRNHVDDADREWRRAVRR